MNILLGSGGFRTPNELGTLREWLRTFVEESTGAGAKRIAVIPFACVDATQYGSRPAWIAKHQILDGHSLSLCTSADSLSELRSADVIFVPGGNTFALLQRLYQFGYIDEIRDLVLSKGKAYIGISAGTNVACPSIMTTNDMPVIYPPTFEALGLVSCQINPHFVSGPAHYQHDGELYAYQGETREDRLNEYLEVQARVVIGIPEATAIRSRGDCYEYLVPDGSTAPARVFSKSGVTPELIQPGSRILHLQSPTTNVRHGGICQVSRK